VYEKGNEDIIASGQFRERGHFLVRLRAELIKALIEDWFKNPVHTFVLQKQPLYLIRSIHFYQFICPNPHKLPMNKPFHKFICYQ
jgi:hypothetical protein